MIAIVHGPDALLVRQAVAKLIAKLDPSGDSTSRIDGKSTPLPQIIAQTSSIGFFGAGRVVVVDDLLGRATKGGKAGDDGTDTPAIDVAPLLSSVPPGNTLILVDQPLHSVPAAVRKVMPPDVEIVAGEPPRGSMLLKWLAGTAKGVGAEIDQRAAQALATKLFPQTWQQKPNNPRYDVPPDLDRLAREIEKLASAALPGPITTAHIDLLVASVADDQIFKFTDAVAKRQIRPAVAELEKLLAAGEEPFAIVAQAMQQAELATVAGFAGPGKDPATVGRDLGLTNPARMSGIAATRRGMPVGSALTDLRQAISVDRQVKRGHLRHPEDALYALIGTPQADE